MTVLYILGVFALLIMLVLLLRVGVYIAFGQELCINAKVGPAKISILPKPEKPEKLPKEKKPKKEKTADGKKEKLKFTFADIRSASPVLLEALKKALRKVRKRMRVDPLQLSITFGGDDPAKAAERYGWANTVMWTLLPQLEELIHIPDPHIHLEVDYNSFTTRAEGEMGISFRVGDLLNIVLTLAIPALKWFLAWRKTQNAPGAALKKEQPHNV